MFQIGIGLTFALGESDLYDRFSPNVVLTFPSKADRRWLFHRQVLASDPNGSPIITGCIDLETVTAVEGMGGLTELAPMPSQCNQSGNFHRLNRRLFGTAKVRVKTTGPLSGVLMFSSLDRNINFAHNICTEIL